MAHGVEVGGIILELPSWTAFAAVGVSGLAGATHAAKRGFDVVGVFTIGMASSLGGLLLRDILLQNGTSVVFTEPLYLVIACATAIAGFFFAGLISQLTPVMVILDGLAMGFLCTAGATSAFKAGLATSSIIFIGVITAVGGLVLRDVISGTAPQIVRPGVFIAFPAIVSSFVFVIVLNVWSNWTVSQMSAMVCALGLRAGSHWLGWHTGSASDLSDRVWGFWYNRRGSVEGRLVPGRGAGGRADPDDAAVTQQAGDP